MINITVTETTVTIAGMSTRPSVTEVDAVVNKLGEALSRSLGAIKMSGYWVIGDTSSDDGWSPLFGHEPGTQVRSLAKALTGALDRRVTIIK